jgi:hypothetical protein
VLGPVPAAPKAAPKAGQNGAGRRSAQDPAQAPAPPDVPQVRALIRVPRRDGPALAASLHAAQSLRSARKDPETVRVQLDPAELI